MRKLLLPVCSTIVLSLAVTGICEEEKSAVPSWDELEEHNEAPDWFRDAKFGIYSHWGVYSVPAYATEWYPRLMYAGGRHCKKHHLATYGEDFHYHDFIPMFKAEKFDADEWADIYKRAGAKFAGPVAEHHDGFAMWDSEYTPFNSAKMGPKRDITAELAKALRKRGLKFMASYHHSHNKAFYKGSNPVFRDPEYIALYGKQQPKDFNKMWFGKLKESVDKYQPDLMWFDFGLARMPHELIREYFDYYFSNHNDAVVTFKNMRWKGITMEQLRKIGIEDFEKGRLNRLTEYAWLTDDTITDGSWCFTRQMKLKPKEYVLHVLIDIVSKNGQLLLNIAPKADGTIPENQQEILFFVGDWLKEYGESIYGTRPFVDFGEGPTRLGKSGHFVKVMKFTPNDVRYTTKGKDTVYAIILGRPEPGQLSLLKMFAQDGLAENLEIKSISMLGTEKKVAWEKTDEGLSITAPSVVPEEEAVVYKIKCKELPELLAQAKDLRAKAKAAKQHAEAKKRIVKNGLLTAKKAVIKGKTLRLEDLGEKSNLGWWNNPEDYATWKVVIDRPGVYEITGDFACEKASTLKLHVKDQSVDFDIPASGGWKNFKTTKGSSTMTFKKGAELMFSLKPADKKNWNAVNVQSLQLIWQDEVQ